MKNNHLLDQILATFENNDTEGLVNLLNEDFEWNMVGGEKVQGKEKIRSMFREAEGKITLNVTSKDHVVIEGDIAVCDGKMIVTENGKSTEQFYCDIYEFLDGKLKRMTSYVINKK